MDEHILVKHNDLFALCNRIHTLINMELDRLEDTEHHRSNQETKSISGDSFAKIVYDAHIFELDRQIRNTEWDIKCLYDIFALALNCAPDDIRDFFIHYDDIAANCPF